ncbi:MAG: prepilin-type N-terminal cleavage/methylation domain-containing protein [Planctomycetota bacterium]|nr:prepilin-type N-terminal cleavage/methylation domain-containing protein [Planctomycetota bacterium]
MHLQRQTRNAFTLMELMIVVLIITFLIVLLTKGVGVVTARSLAADCMKRMAAVGNAVKSQAVSAQGKFEVEPGAFVSSFAGNLKLRGETGYNQAAAFAIEDFICPTDRNPFYLTTGYKTSYVLSNAFIGTRASQTAGEMVMLSEVGRRHKNKEAMGANYLYSDMNIRTTGSDSSEPENEIHMQGLRARCWTQSSLTLTNSQPRAELVWASELRWLQKDKLHFLPKEYYDPASGWTSITEWNQTNPDDYTNILIILDGYLEIPRDGAWTLSFQHAAPAPKTGNATCEGEVRLGTTENRGSFTFGPADDLNIQTNKRARGTLTLPNLKAGKHPVEFIFQSNKGMYEMNFYWRGPGETTPSVIPAKSLSHVAFERTNLPN